VVVHDDFDWGDDRQLRPRWRDTVVYELHVKGMTAAARPGARAPARHLRRARAPAVTDYLRDLGVTAVELLPVHQFATEPRVPRAG
jgi:glycogen operon protein